MIIDLSFIAGTIGGIFVLAAYYLLSAKKTKPHSIVYNALNLLGGVGLTINTFVTKSWPSVILNVIWIGIAAFSIYQTLNTKPVYRTMKARE